MKRQIQNGFTLIELMIVLTVLTIILAVAIPTFKDFMMRARRSDGRDSLLAMELAQEKWRANNISYTLTLGNMGMSSTSNDGHYNISVEAGTVSATTYTLMAEPTGIQAKDTACLQMKMTENGVKTPAACWKK